MQQDEYVTSINYNGALVNIGMDDYGQSYFIEYADGESVVTVGCGTYNTDYMSTVEYCLGDPKKCELFEQNASCEEWDRHGFCCKCPHSELIIRRDERLRKRKEKESQQN